MEDELVEQLTSQYSEVTISGATVIGSLEDYIKVRFPGGTYLVNGQQIEVAESTVELPVAGFKDLSNLTLLPLASPQFSLGTVMGTRTVFRFLPSMEVNKDLGKFSYFGFGIQHNPAVWLNQPLPVDLAVGFFTQTLKVGDLFKTKTTAFGINASKQFGSNFLNVTPYAGILRENAKMEVGYDYLVETPAGTAQERIEFQLEGENRTRLTMGLSFRLLILNINADYNLGKYKSVSTGLNISF
ncbi:MAG: DUF6588 family protein, partial [Calditrichia bacterium]